MLRAVLCLVRLPKAEMRGEAKSNVFGGGVGASWYVEGQLTTKGRTRTRSWTKH